MAFWLYAVAVSEALAAAVTLSLKVSGRRVIGLEELLIALPMALGGTGVTVSAFRLCLTAGSRGAALCLIPAFAFGVLCLGLRKSIPERDWREEGNRRTDALAFAPSGIPVLAVFAGPAGILTGSILLATVTGLYVLGILFGALFLDCREERGRRLTESQYRDDMRSFVSVIRSQRHDYNFHVGVIAGLIREGKIDECKRYVTDLERDFIRMNDILPVRDPAVSATIMNFMTLASREGIELKADISDDLSGLVTGAYETNKVISNLLQNAIDEVRTHRDKSYGIHLTVLKRGEYAVIRVSNEMEQRPGPEEMGRFFDQGYSTKSGHDGVGLAGVKVLLSRCRGTVYTELDGNVIHFVAKIPKTCVKLGEYSEEGA